MTIKKQIIAIGGGGFEFGGDFLIRRAIRSVHGNEFGVVRRHDAFRNGAAPRNAAGTDDAPLNFIFSVHGDFCKK